jgi:hypothetical protein
MILWEKIHQARSEKKNYGLQLRLLIYGTQSITYTINNAQFTEASVLGLDILQLDW